MVRRPATTAPTARRPVHLRPPLRMALRRPSGRGLVDQVKARAKPTERARGPRPVHLAQSRGELSSLLTVGYPKTRLSDLVPPKELTARVERVLTEQRERDAELAALAGSLGGLRPEAPELRERRKGPRSGPRERTATKPPTHQARKAAQ